MTEIKSISVFCGSSIGKETMYHEEAYSMGAFLASQKISLVYGGAKVGLMGSVANGALDSGGKVIGVIPDFISDKEIAHNKLTELIIVKSMHDRKMTMFEKSDGAIVLPGGFGTLDEMFEILTWGQLGLHTKPLGIFNILAYFDLLIGFTDHMVSQNLLRQGNRDMMLVSNDKTQLLQLMKNYKAPQKAKWISIDQV